MKADLFSALFPTAFILLFVGMFGAVFVFIAASGHADKRARARLRVEGIRGDALIRSFRAISQTQHRVLVDLTLPTGRFGREIVLTGLTNEWLAHQAGLAQRVPVFANAAGTQISFDGVEEGPTPTVGETMRFVLMCLLGLLVFGAVVFGVFYGLARSRRTEVEASIDPDVLRLRDALDRQGLHVDGLSIVTPRIRSTWLQQSVRFELDAGETCVVDVRRMDIAKPTTSSGPPVLENGKLSLRCDPSPAAQLPRVREVFTAFR